MRVVSLVISALCAVSTLALTATCSGPTTTAAVVYEPQADGLHVLDHGSEPRRLIEYKVRELEPFIMTMTGGVKATEEGAKNTFPAYNHEGLMRAVLRGPTADGGFTGNMIDLGSSRARAIGFVVGEDGRMLLPDRAEQKSLLFVQVPQIPVGVGARWRTRLPVSMLGDTLPVVVEVAAWTGDELHLRATWEEDSRAIDELPMAIRQALIEVVDFTIEGTSKIRERGQADFHLTVPHPMARRMESTTWATMAMADNKASAHEVAFEVRNNFAVSGMTKADVKTWLADDEQMSECLQAVHGSVYGPGMTLNRGLAYSCGLSECKKTQTTDNARIPFGSDDNLCNMACSADAAAKAAAAPPGTGWSVLASECGSEFYDLPKDRPELASSTWYVFSRVHRFLARHAKHHPARVFLIESMMHRGWYEIGIPAAMQGVYQLPTVPAGDDKSIRYNDEHAGPPVYVVVNREGTRVGVTPRAIFGAQGVRLRLDASMHMPGELVPSGAVAKVVTQTFTSLPKHLLRRIYGKAGHKPLLIVDEQISAKTVTELTATLPGAFLARVADSWWASGQWGYLPLLPPSDDTVDIEVTISERDVSITRGDVSQRFTYDAKSLGELREYVAATLKKSFIDTHLSHVEDEYFKQSEFHSWRFKARTAIATAQDPMEVDSYAKHAPLRARLRIAGQATARHLVLAVHALEYLPIYLHVSAK